MEEVYTTYTHAWLCQHIVENTQEAIIFADREGMIRLWNTGAEAIFGYTAAEVLGQSLELIIPERLQRQQLDAAGNRQQGGLMSTATTWPIFTAKLKSRQEVAEGTMAFHFEKPVGWAFRAGQFIDITLLDPSETDTEGNTRGFSIASAPHEEPLMVATRMRNTAFKRGLMTMPLETAVKIEGPFGNLTLHNNAARPVVMLAGGIGITPFRSILFSAAKEKLPHRIFLFYSNRRPEDAPFLEVLQALGEENPNYKLIATMTQMEKSHQPWHGETGLINKGMLSRYLKDAVSPIYYIAGPAGMVKGLHIMLNEAGVDDDDIRTEEFIGY